MEKKIEIEVLYESKDFWRSYLNYYFSYDTIFIFFLTFAIYGIFIAFLLLGGDADLLNLIDIVSSTFLFVVLFGLVMLYFSVKNAKRLEQEKYGFIFSEAKVEINAESFRTQFDWTHIIQVKETGTYLILSLKSNQRTFCRKDFLVITSN